MNRVRENDELIISEKLLHEVAFPMGLFPGKKDDGHFCYRLHRTEDGEAWGKITTSYFIGAAWISEGFNPLLVYPKTDDTNGKRELDFMSMLIQALSHISDTRHLQELVYVNFDQPLIKIERRDDYLSPLLIVQYLHLLRRIVKKGLKQDYYRVDRDLRSRVKGKIRVNETIKRHHARQKLLHTACTFDEFGIDTPENRLLKRALQFSSRYLEQFRTVQPDFGDLDALLCFVRPAFEKVSDAIRTTELRHFKPNQMYREYRQALQLAKLILRRFGYSSTQMEQQTEVSIPPFWIDMSKLFELYVYGMLKEAFGGAVTYHFSTNGNEIDFLLDSEIHKMVIDAKYKLRYQNGVDHQDIRQVSGYARLKKVYQKLGIENFNQNIDTLIIYPDNHNGLSKIGSKHLKANEIREYVKTYKLGVSLPFKRL